MAGALTIMGLYLLASVFIGVIAGRFNRSNAEGYFLASRGLSAPVMFFTLFATNISAFAYMGAPGGAYHLGVGFFGYLATTTSMAAVFFYVIGYRSWLLSRKFNFLTASELFEKRFGSKAVGLVFLIVMAFYTVPYAAVQPIGAGNLLNGLSQGAIPYWVGAVITTLFIAVYVYVGGLRAVAWTDFFQGVLMIGLVILAFCLVMWKMGGITHVATDIATNYPKLLTREAFTFQQWASFGLIIALGVPMFPQLFTKYFAARSADSLKTTMNLYPLAMIIIYVPVLFMGAFAHSVIPNLVGKQSDAIIPLLLSTYVPLWLAGLILAAPLAAIMSSLSSQLITISTMFTRDIYLRYVNPQATSEKQIVVGRVIIAVLGIMAAIIALKPPGAILTIVSWAFTGYAILFPATIAGLFWKRSTAAGVISSILLGQAVFFLFSLKVLPKSLLIAGDIPLTVLPFTAVVLVVVSLLTKPHKYEAECADTQHNYLDPIFKGEQVPADRQMSV